MEKHSLLDKSVKRPFCPFFEDFQTMIVETDNQSKLGKLIKNKDESFAVKPGENIPIPCALDV